MKRNTSTLLLASLVGALIVGCSTTPPTAGERMLSQSESTRDLGKQWQSGKDMVVRGERIRAEGIKAVDKGNMKVKEGDRLITEGNTMMKESEELYKSRFPGQSLAPSKP